MFRKTPGLVKPGMRVRVLEKGQNPNNPSTWSPNFKVTNINDDEAEVCPLNGNACRQVPLTSVRQQGVVSSLKGIMTGRGKSRRLKRRKQKSTKKSKKMRKTKKHRRTKRR